MMLRGTLSFLSISFLLISILSISILSISILSITGHLALAKDAPKITRASQLSALAVGVGADMHFEDYMRLNPGSHTAILSYVRIDTEEVAELVQHIRINIATQTRLKREFWPQIALETRDLSLSEFTKQLSTHGSRIDINVRRLAAEIAKYRSRNKYFFLRPFSEMNDGTDANPWEFANKTHKNNGTDLATAWKLLHDVFDQEGATNAIFIFSPLAANRVHNEQEVMVALDKIPVGYIDAFGLNVYSRPKSAYGGTSPEPFSFAELVQPWLKLAQTSRHRGIPLAVAEMGVSNQASDPLRAKWLREAFSFARAHGYVMLTYFNYPHPYWTILPNTEAGTTLKECMNQYEGLKVTDMRQVQANTVSSTGGKQPGKQQNPTDKQKTDKKKEGASMIDRGSLQNF